MTEDALRTWMTTLADALGVDPGLEHIAALLDLARDAAHGVARPAAPLTTYLAGLAAGSRGGSPDAIAEVIATAQRLAAQHQPPS